MAETHLKFGPEWLRALSHGNNLSSPPQSPGITKYKLSDYRYGREEMLGLFHRNLKMPEELNEFPNLCKEKLQLPLAFITMTEEEQRLWARSVNSDTTLRHSSKAGTVSGTSTSNTNSVRGLRGGGAADRGKGRGRGLYFSRGLSVEDGEEGPASAFSRTRTFERNQTSVEKDQLHDEREKRYDRSYSGRSNEENGYISRKEGCRVSTDNWRVRDQHRNVVDEGDWRMLGSRGSSHWVSGNSSWRNHSDRDPGREDKDGKDGSSLHDSELNFSKNGLFRPSIKDSYCDGRENNGHDQLPEWSREDQGRAECVGSFDSSGAFMETKVDECSSDDSETKRMQYETNEIKFRSSRQSMGERKNGESTKLNSESASHETSDNDDLYVSSPDKEADDEDVSFLPEAHPVSTKIQNFEENQKQSKASSSVTVSISNGASESVPDVNRAEETKCFSNCVTSNVNVGDSSKSTEEDGFFHLVKAAENMMAQWTAEEEQEVTSQAQCVEKNTILPLQHEDAYKWFYRDPQGIVQGPFASHEMFEWFTAGYFTLNLLVRRGCDERFAPLGELLKVWGRIPFVPGSDPPPLRSVSLSTPKTTLPEKVPPVSLSQDQDGHLRLFQQHLLHQQLLQQQVFLRQQFQLQQLLTQTKQEQGFSSIPSQPQQQQQIVSQQIMATQLPRSTSLPKPPNLLDPVSPLQLPLLGFSLSPLLKNDAAFPWPLTAGNIPANWMMNSMNVSQPPSSGGIWDVEVNPLPATLDIKQKETEQQEEEEEEEVEEVNEVKQEQEEEINLQDEQNWQAEKEQKLQVGDEVQRKHEVQQEQWQEEKEERHEWEEVENCLIRQKKEVENKRHIEVQNVEKQQKHVEMKMLEEEFRNLQLDKQEQDCKQMQQVQEERQQPKQQEVEQLGKRDLEKLKELQLKQDVQIQKELDQHQELKINKEVEREREVQRKTEKHIEMQQDNQNETLLKPQENQQKVKPQIPAWGGQTPNARQNVSESLADIQRLQEEEEERQEQEHQRQLHFQQQLISLQQRQTHLSWAQRPVGCPGAVKSLLEIQQEEAEQLAKKKLVQPPRQPSVSITAASGVWNNPSNSLSWGHSNAPWRIGDNTSSGFWDDTHDPVHHQRMCTSKSIESAFPALNISSAPNSLNSNKNKSSRRKDEEVVMKLFETHTKQNMDEFTKWCTEALSHFPPTIDVPTFVAFLKDVDSPYEVHDYVRSYLGDSKESREFAKHFMERRSKYRNDARQQTTSEESFLKPVLTSGNGSTSVKVSHRKTLPINVDTNITNIINTCVNRNSNNSGDANSKGGSGNGGKKKKKNRMQKLDNSMLGFTVQADPDRINVGEIVRGESM